MKDEVSMKFSLDGGDWKLWQSRQLTAIGTAILRRVTEGNGNCAVWKASTLSAFQS